MSSCGMSGRYSFVVHTWYTHDRGDVPPTIGVDRDRHVEGVGARGPRTTFATGVEVHIRLGSNGD
jgi:hypothetical protein